ncbi:hypothetical protein [Corynebacterium comes]|uniref:Uncharacterized protein n=1 Tax=Corynebacterium comes TaxID=2675218 RepID=A0A6B8VZH0_9CORY|nr:hypothetical protein [Corynebacterium comes]QGU05107.1 hypothetical protein CETAM_09270 [Corynebacterium comes]
MTADSADRPWVSERFAGLDPHETSSDHSEDAGDPSGRAGDTNREEAA